MCIYTFQTLFIIENCGSNELCICVGNARRLLVFKIRRDFILDKTVMENVTYTQSIDPLICKFDFKEGTILTTNRCVGFDGLEKSV